MPGSVGKVAVRTALAAVATAGLVAVGGITPASAQIVSFCSGVAGPVTVPGDLIIRANDFCVLEGTTVDGNTTVRAGASLVTNGATLNGRVTAQSDASVDLSTTTVTGRILLRDGFGLLAVDSTLNGNIVVNRVDPQAPPGAALLIGTASGGSVNAKVGAIWIGDSTVAGRVTGNGVDFVDLVNTVLEGDLTLTGAGQGSVVCDSEIYGEVSYADNIGPVQLGGDSLIAGCEGANYWDGSLSIANTEGDVLVANNIIRADLSGDGNDPSPAGDGNRVRGQTSGQFTDLAPAGESPSLAPNRSAQAEDRGVALRDRFDIRRAVTRIVANVLGDAGL